MLTSDDEKGSQLGSTTLLDKMCMKHYYYKNYFRVPCSVCSVLRAPCSVRVCGVPHAPAVGIGSDV